MQPRLTIVCSKHNCNLRGVAKLTAEIKADRNPNLHGTEEGSEPTSHYLFDLSDMRCPWDGYDLGGNLDPDTCADTWTVSLHIVL